ncbi:response regulator [Paraburkholderia sp. SIMBA_027]|uniref:response regulator n=1 Tax=Paraburkholderia sp. SIMBA_027 TaxID=3085770 RepID=UPI00397A2A01
MNIRGVSVDTIERVNIACSAAGLASWAGVVTACHGGTLHRVEFAARRPVDFVKEFAALVRACELKLGTDSSLELYLGSESVVASLNAPGTQCCREHGSSVVTLADLGLVRDEEVALVACSAAPRSAGVTRIKRDSTQPLAGKTILVLDDDDVSRSILTAALRREGCRIEAVGEAEAAFGLLRDAAPDLVVLDIVLGGTLDGFDVCRAMRTNPDYAVIPVIFVTAYPTDHFRLNASGVEFAAYFEKPVKPSLLRDTIQALTCGNLKQSGA